jgi:hypothetical protein
MTLERCPKCDGNGIVELDDNIWIDDTITELIKEGHIKIAVKMMEVKENI